MSKCWLKNRAVKSSFFLFIFLSLSASCFSYDFAGGTGEPNDPYQISTAAQLLQIGSDPNLLNKSYILLNDIDLDPNVTGIPPFTQAPIAPDTNPTLSDFQGTKFTGIFDGNNQKIRNLIIDTGGIGNDFLGLFGQISGSAAQVKNLGIENSVITGGADSIYLGGLCGYNSFGTLSNSYSSAQVTSGTDSYNLGGLCGYNYGGTISNCYSSGSVSGGSYLSGLCGENYYGTISSCYSSGSVSGNGHLGGLCGRNIGTISNCYSAGSVSGYSHLGGLCGRNYGTLINCYATGSVSGYNFLGGLCGRNDGTITNCCSSDSVTGDASSWYLGGLCGLNDSGMISNCYSSGQVAGEISSRYSGGLCGKNSGTLSNCYSTSSVSGGSSLGGLCGYNTGTLINCYSIGQVTGGTGSYILGGLCGHNIGTLSNCYFYLFSGPDNNGGTDLETGQMIEQESFPGFDFAGNPEDGTDDYWAITAGYCPKLAWQTDDGPLPPSFFPDTNLPGSGTADDPFQINNAEDFSEFITNDQLNCGYYVLACDIDLSGQNFTTAVINRYFGGHLDAGGHRIANITIDSIDSNNDYLGMFGRVCGSICNLAIENISIIGGTDSDYIGSLCGENYYGTLSNCYSTGSVSGHYHLGGLCGVNYYGAISNCYAVGSVSGDVYLGGLCGSNSGTISNCYTTGSISGDEYLGGLCGGNWSGMISKCYSSGSVSGDQYKGGFCGYNDNGFFTSCFWDRETSTMTDGVGNMNPDPNTVQGKTTAEMKILSTFTDTGWDFENIWAICEGTNYPRLKWQISQADLICPDGVDFIDFAFFADYWLNSDCAALNDCSRSDFDLSGIVDANDLNIFTSHWLQN